MNELNAILAYIRSARRNAQTSVFDTRRTLASRCRDICDQLELAEREVLQLSA